MRRFSALVTAALASGCVANRCHDLPAAPASVLAIGDSLQAWDQSYCQSIPDHVAMTSGLGVRNEAQNGASLLFDIPFQYKTGDWDWVIIDGGANDVNASCPGDGCQGKIDRLVSKDGSTGAMPELVDKVLADGARVILLRYYFVPEHAWYGFDEVQPEIFELGERYVALAAARDGVVLVDLREQMSPETTPALYAFDLVHPDPRAAKKLGAVIAAVMQK